jgi:hypothetical protein
MSDSATGDLVEVRILELPVALRQRSTQYEDELLREMTLITERSTEAPTAEHVPTKLVAFAAEVRSTLSAFTVEGTAAIDSAAADDVEVIDELVYRVPPSIGPYCRHILKVIDEADAYCREGQYLLTLAAPRDVRAYQRWIVGEFIRQTAGGAPTSWPEFRHRYRG